MYKYGEFLENGKEFAITDPATPRSFDNFIWNDSMFSNIQQTGVGYFDYQIGELEPVQLLTGNGRVCDFDIFGRDNLMSRLIYIRDNDTGEYWNAGWEPVCAEYEQYRCIHGVGYTKIESTTSKIASSFRIFAPKGSDPCELWSLSISNKSSKKRSLSIFVYNQFQFRYKWGFDSYGDMLFRSSEFDVAQNAVVASKHPHIRPHDFLIGYLTADKAITAFDGTRAAFVGTYNTLKNPQAVIDGKCTNTPGAADATIGAAQFDFQLDENGVFDISLILGVTDDAAKISQFKSKYFGNMETYFNAMIAQNEEMYSRNIVKTPDEHINRMLNTWVKAQASYGADWCRWGWDGYRDIVQHGFGVCPFNSKRTKEILLEAVKYQYSSGLALRGWNPIDTKPYSDCALWLVFTFVEYIKETADMAVLEEIVPFYDEGEDTLLGHIERALNFLETHKGAHELCLIKFGDWNDSLTAVGKGGKGESVWLSMAYAEAARQMAEFYVFLGDLEKSKDCDRKYQSMKKAINDNAWDGEWYRRCYDDTGHPIGSDINDEGKIFSEPQGWALIADLADEERAESLISACDRLLGTNQGYKLLAPTFTKIDDRVGRISSMEPGICENGTLYSHINIWIILGLLKTGRADKAYEAFKLFTSGYHEPSDKKDLCPPYVYANCYFGPDHRNNAMQMEFAWVTGSIAWVNQALNSAMLGVAADYKGLKIDPCIPSGWTEYSVSRVFRGTRYNIEFKNPTGKNKGKVSITLDGGAIEGNIIPSLQDKKEHSVLVEIE